MAPSISFIRPFEMCCDCDLHSKPDLTVSTTHSTLLYVRNTHKQCLRGTYFRKIGAVHAFNIRFSFYTGSPFLTFYAVFCRAAKTVSDRGSPIELSHQRLSVVATPSIVTH